MRRSLSRASVVLGPQFRLLTALMWAVAGGWLAVACSSSNNVTVVPPLVDGGNQGLVSPLIDGGLEQKFAAPCSTDDQCQSGVCDAVHNGNCCLHACNQDDPLCGAQGCDIFGQCVYPGTQLSCGGSCANARLTLNACDGQGRCLVGDAGTSCPTNSGCDVSGTSCTLRCQSAADCAADAYCASSGDCVPRQATGYCQEDQQCASGYCGVAGQGACCLAPCSVGDLECGATGCDAVSGACLYPAAGAVCGTSTCASPGSAVSLGGCDARGSCLPAPPSPCPNSFACSADQHNCDTVCLTNDSCSVGSFCDVSYSQCCPAIQPGQTVFISGTQPSDAPCCGSSPDTACATISNAIRLVGEANVQGVTLQVFGGSPNGSFDGLPPGACDWPNLPLETFPLHLGLGMTLSAPGIALYPLTEAFTALIEVAPYNDSDTAPVAIRGSSVATGLGELGCYGPVLLGADATYQHYQTTGVAIDDAQNALPLPLARPNLPLILDSVTVSAALQAFPSPPGQPKEQNTVAVDIGPGADLTLGPGRVTVGGLYGYYYGGAQNAFNFYHEGPSYGIRCLGTAESHAKIHDDPAGTNVLTAHLAYIADLLVQPYCDVSLTQGPQFGVTPFIDYNANNSYSCPTGVGASAVGQPVDTTPLGDQQAIWVTGPSQVTIGSAAQPAVIACMQKNAVNVTYLPEFNFVDNFGYPHVTLDHTQIFYSGCAAVYDSMGLVTAVGSSFNYNTVGVWQDSDPSADAGQEGTIDLSGGGNNLACNFGAPQVQAAEIPLAGCLDGILSSQGVYVNYGADAVNTTQATSLNASNVQWDYYQGTGANGATQLWTCAAGGNGQSIVNGPIDPNDPDLSQCSCAGPGCSGYTPTCPVGITTGSCGPQNAQALALLSTAPANGMPIRTAGGSLSPFGCDGGPNLP